MTTLLWGALPYIALALLVAGLVWRYRYDKYGWTTRSSQVYESKLLNLASPCFQRTRSPVFRATETIAPWARSLFTLQPKTRLMEGVPVLYQVHAVIGMLLIALVPYSRLVHMFSAPVQYLFRPYVVYRTRDPRQLGPRPERRGWERLGG
ncbi:respiratory nitrate reductase subunit gamma [Streptomyces sp. NPDC001165]|uniref:respiratory nitrate reductase subunit gamma n=1 Tax=Streptomyces sp. NPDC001165 TaxID=3364546 RepID=UPI0036BB1B71